MKRWKTTSGHREQGVVILLVAVFLLFVVGAIAALAIDVVSFYTARSEAQLAADGAALAAARVIANSGMTSKPADVSLVASVESLARAVATQVAVRNKVGGRNLIDDGTEIRINIDPAPPPSTAGSANPQVTVRISRNDLPIFFARIWGRTQAAVSATATAEAYNPSGLNAAAGDAPPVAPVCVKPWVLPNIDPRNGTQIFDPSTGGIKDPNATLLGADPTVRMFARCQNCSTLPTPNPWQYYPGSPTSFPAPTQALPTCTVALNPYQETVAGCMQTPIACHSSVSLDAVNHPGRNAQTARAVNCLTHSENDTGDSVDTAAGPNPPFEFLSGDANPLALPTGTKMLVSDSIVTVPVYNSTTGIAPPSTGVQIIGFVQLFLNPDGVGAPTSGGFGVVGRMKTTVINLVGCGTNATTQPIVGNGGSAVAVRLLSP